MDPAVPRSIPPTISEAGSRNRLRCSSELILEIVSSTSPHIATEPTRARSRLGIQSPSCTLEPTQGRDSKPQPQRHPSWWIYSAYPSTKLVWKSTLAALSRPNNGPASDQKTPKTTVRILERCVISYCAWRATVSPLPRSSLIGYSARPPLGLVLVSSSSQHSPVGSQNCSGALPPRFQADSSFLPRPVLKTETFE